MVLYRLFFGPGFDILLIVFIPFRLVLVLPLYLAIILWSQHVN
jgi:hypothetical protein